MKGLNEIAENYFNSLNPIAARISTDIVAIKDAYEGLWRCLTLEEKNQIINETVVHPEAILKYTLSTKASEGASLDFPLITRHLTGVKYIVDENTGQSWRDEHSAPFSWKTPSQIDLTIFMSSNDETDMKLNKSFFSKKITANENALSSQSEKSFSPHLENEKCSSYKNDTVEGKKMNASNVVLVGTCSKLSGLCSKLKFLPGKSYSYEVQTVVTNASVTSDGSFLDKIKASALLKFQNTFKLVGGKNLSEKKSDNKETENLIQSKETENLIQSKETASLIRLQKPSPKIPKPKSPPPPPPVVRLSNAEEKDDSKTSKNFILVKNGKFTFDVADTEKTTLLEENSVQSFLSADPDSLDQDLESKVAHELSDDFNSLSTECTPLSGPSVEVIPKSGFDFLDNW